MKKERMLDKKEKTQAAAFFYRKMPVTLTLLKGEGWGEVLTASVCPEDTIASVKDCAKHNPYDALRA